MSAVAFLLYWFIISVVLYLLLPIMLIISEENSTSLSLEQIDRINKVRHTKIIAIVSILALPLFLLILVCLKIKERLF